MPLNKKKGIRPFRQLRLGTTEDNELTLVKFVKRQPQQIVRYEADLELFSYLPFSQLSELEIESALRPPFPILLLPEELVSQILTVAVRTEHQKSSVWYRRKRNKIALSLCLVCKVFRRLAQPLLFSLVTIRAFPGRNDPPDESVDKLCRTFQTNPSFQRYCRDLVIHVPDDWHKDFDTTIQMLQRFVNVKSLRVEGLFDNTVGNSDFSENNRDLWAFLCPILQRISGVEELYISSRCGGFGPGLGLPLHPLCSTLSSMQRLKSLRVYRVSKRFDYTPFVVPKVELSLPS